MGGQDVVTPSLLVGTSVLHRLQVVEALYEAVILLPLEEYIGVSFLYLQQEFYVKFLALGGHEFVDYLLHRVVVQLVHIQLGVVEYLIILARNLILEQALRCELTHNRELTEGLIIREEVHVILVIEEHDCVEVAQEVHGDELGGVHARAHESERAQFHEQ